MFAFSILATPPITIKMTRLILIRHTRVDVPKGMIYGNSNVDLAPTFEKEAAIILNQINSPFDAVYSSTLTRCKILAEKISSKVILDNRLKELNFGNWEGKYWNEIDQTTEAKQWFENYINEKCPNGESYIDLLERTNDFLKELSLKNYENVCIVSHGGPIRAFIVAIEGISPEKAFDRKIDFGEIIQLNID